MGSHITVKIEGFTTKGMGKGRHKDWNLVVPFSIPGETIEVRIIRKRRNKAFGAIDKIRIGSNSRITPKCPFFTYCRCCSWQMISYPLQLKFKRETIENAFLDNTRLRLPQINKTVGMDNPWSYRNRASFYIERKKRGVIMGFPSRKDRYGILDIDFCPLLQEGINTLIVPMKNLLSKEPVTIYNPHTDRGRLKSVKIMNSEITKETLVSFVLKDRGFSKKLAQKVALLSLDNIIGINEETDSTHRVVFGREYYLEKIAGRVFRISAQSIFPINIIQTEKLLSEIKDFICPSELVVEIGTGVGIIALGISDYVKRVVGIESTLSYIDANHNQEVQNQGNVEFFEGKGEEYIDFLKDMDGLVFQGDREELGEEILIALSRIKVERIVYISSQPLSFARDIERLVRIGYRIDKVTPYDFLPHTHNVLAAGFLIYSES